MTEETNPLAGTEIPKENEPIRVKLRIHQVLPLDLSLSGNEWSISPIEFEINHYGKLIDIPFSKLREQINSGMAILSSGKLISIPTGLMAYCAIELVSPLVER